MCFRVCVATLALLAVATGTTRAQGFECAPLQPSASRTPAYRIVAGQTRCEGFYDRSVSQPFIELVSLTRGPLPAPGGSTAPILEFHADVPVPARLVVQPKRSGPFYRVDAALQGGQAMPWDPAPMLAVTGLRLSDLGFVAVTKRSTTVTSVAPVALTPAGRQANRANAVVRVSVPVSSVAWRTYRLRADAAATSAWIVVPNSQLYEWQRTTFPIDLPSDGKELRVDVQAIATSDGLALPFLLLAIVGPRDGNP